jgi:hypothetical protein
MPTSFHELTKSRDLGKEVRQYDRGEIPALPYQEARVTAEIVVHEPHVLVMRQM